MNPLGISIGLVASLHRARFVSPVKFTCPDSSGKNKDLDPPEFRLRVGDYRIRFHQDNDTMRI